MSGVSLKSLDLIKLFGSSYLLDWLPPRESELIFDLAIIFSVAIVASAIVWLLFIRQERREPILRLIRSRLVLWLFTTGFGGLLLVFFRWQGIPYFAGRIWLVLWLLGAGVWFLFILLYLLKKFPKERSLYHERLLKERYLPKPKQGSR